MSDCLAEKYASMIYGVSPLDVAVIASSSSSLGRIEQRVAVRFFLCANPTMFNVQ